VRCGCALQEGKSDAIVSETRTFDAGTGKSVRMRRKVSRVRGAMLRVCPDVPCLFPLPPTRRTHWTTASCLSQTFRHLLFPWMRLRK